MPPHGKGTYGSKRGRPPMKKATPVMKKIKKPVKGMRKK